MSNIEVAIHDENAPRVRNKIVMVQNGSYDSYARQFCVQFIYYPFLNPHVH